MQKLEKHEPNIWYDRKLKLAAWSSLITEIAAMPSWKRQLTFEQQDLKNWARNQLQLYCVSKGYNKFQWGKNLWQQKQYEGTLHLYLEWEIISFSMSSPKIHSKVWLCKKTGECRRIISLYIWKFARCEQNKRPKNHRKRSNVKKQAELVPHKNSIKEQIRAENIFLEWGPSSIQHLLRHSIKISSYNLL